MQFNHMARFAYPVVALLILSGCGPSQEQFDERVSVLRQEPKYREKVLQGCIENHHRAPTDFSNLARHMGVTRKRVPKLACQRMIAALIDGRLTYQDFNELITRGEATDNSLSIIVGKPVRTR